MAPPHGSGWSTLAMVPPGLEAQAAAELEVLGAGQVQPLRRAVACRTDAAVFYRLHLQARLPFRLLRHLARFRCTGPDDLRRGVLAAADWDHWLPPDRSLRVEVSGRSPAFPHSHYTALAVKNALVDHQRQQWGQRSSVDRDDPDLVLHLHLSAAEAVLALDGSGTSLHRRGYRTAMGLAPLKENLAAGLIGFTGYDGRQPLLDPCCGSGSLLIEAAAIALARAPGLEADGATVPDHARGRSFGFQRWPDFDGRLWRHEVVAAAAMARQTTADGSPLAAIVGRDSDADVVGQAAGNADRAGVAPWLDLQVGGLDNLQPPPGPGLVVCNPPYGHRLGDPDVLEALYAQLGQVLRDRCGGWTLWLLSGQPKLTGALRLKASRRIPVSNGGIDCRWLRYDLR
ncbi:MAG: THUMP domain-containing class I SAM-dependent RNA methyltransferase [Prochlorococcaceae cyanobacterium]